ncbi:hypothetical protein FLM55_02880 [Francisella sp. Scap27]|uniref:hypothetical protein n=1 Tax=Francisella sp. Scap27 TaxID=2589986 RepID=UPI0015BF45E8|nr:hypothetical protein [Francisella sp. Scap27]QLE78741.1 hypothetical protein FLM55_02880 [Francisella sp. Scap27]
MAELVTQQQVNEKCDLLRLQNEEITVSKIRKLIGSNISMIDLIEKVTVYKESRFKAYDLAKNEQVVETVPKRDKLLTLLEQSFTDFGIDKKELVVSLRNRLTDFIACEVSKQTQKLRQIESEVSNKNASLEISQLTLNKRYKELLEKYNSLKEDSYTLKQNYNKSASKYREIENAEKALLDWEDFKGVKDQILSLKSYGKLAVYDKNGQIIIKFPATDFLTQECRSGKSRYLKAKAVYDYNIQAWALSEFSDISKTLDFLKRNKFVFSKELETIVYHQNKNSAE